MLSPLSHTPLPHTAAAVCLVKTTTVSLSASIISFVTNWMYPFDIGEELSSKEIAIRVGTHCAPLVAEKYMIDSSVRLSFGLYNTKEEIDYLIKIIKNLKEMI